MNEKPIRYVVRDTRGKGRRVPGGPYATKEEAQRWVDDLNDYVWRNTRNDARPFVVGEE